MVTATSRQPDGYVSPVHRLHLAVVDGINPKSYNILRKRNLLKM